MTLPEKMKLYLKVVDLLNYLHSYQKSVSNAADCAHNSMWASMFLTRVAQFAFALGNMD